MAFDFTFLTDIFSEFYSFFMRIATFLAQTPANIAWDFDHGAIFTWSFYNPFIAQTVESFISEGITVNTFVRFLVDLGFAYTPLWAILLIEASTIWLITFIIKAINTIL